MTGNICATDAKILREWLESIPFGRYNAVKRQLVEKCLVSGATFKNWRYGKCRIPMAAKRDINEISMLVSGYEIFTIVKPEDNSKA